MNRRERRIARMGRRAEWARMRREKADETYKRFRVELDTVPMGEPVKVGHHSERAHRRARERIDALLRRTIEHRETADRHEEAAGALKRELERSIYSDDEDAVVRLESRIAEREATRARLKRANRRLRSALKAGASPSDGDLRGYGYTAKETGDLRGYERMFKRLSTYPLVNVTSSINRDRSRLRRLQAQAEQRRASEEHGHT